MNEEFHIDVYETATGKLPYSEWENSLSVKDRAVITTRLVRIRRGNLAIVSLLKRGMASMNFALTLVQNIEFIMEFMKRRSSYCYVEAIKELRKRTFQEPESFGVTI